MYGSSTLQVPKQHKPLQDLSNHQMAISRFHHVPDAPRTSMFNIWQEFQTLALSHLYSYLHPTNRLRSNPKVFHLCISTKGIATKSKKLRTGLLALLRTERSDATNGAPGIASRSILASSNKKLFLNSFKLSLFELPSVSWKDLNKA